MPSQSTISGAYTSGFVMAMRMMQKSPITINEDQPWARDKVEAMYLRWKMEP
jgi:hypothetical protein